MSDRVHINEANLDRVMRWIAAADSKATTFLAIWTLAAAGFAASVTWMGKALSLLGAGPLPLAVLAFGVAYIFFADRSLRHLLAVLFPRQRSLRGLVSPLYGEAIVKMKEEEFINAMMTMTDDLAAEELAKQTWRMQHVCSGKFNDLVKARVPLAVSIALMFGYLITSSLLGHLTTS